MINNYCTGYPCKMGSTGNEVFGRIIGEHEDGSWGEINGKKMFSIPMFCTPGGNILKTGIVHLKDLNEEDLEKLYGFEQHPSSTQYNQKLNGVDLKSIDEKLF
jgi:hypothetical protein